MQKEIHTVTEFIKNKVQELRKSKDKRKIFLILLLIPFIPGIVWSLVALGLMIYLMYGSEDK